MFFKVVAKYVLLFVISAKWDSLFLSVTLALHFGVSSWSVYRTTTACNILFSLFKVAFYFLFVKTFKANSDRYTVVGHDLEKPIRARYLRIVPEDWYGYIALRAEFYGCKTSKLIFL